MLSALVAMQEFDGSFEATSALAAIAGIAHNIFHAAAIELNTTDAAVATVVAILIFETKLAHMHDDWKFVVSKVGSILLLFSTAGPMTFGSYRFFSILIHLMCLSVRRFCCCCSC